MSEAFHYAIDVRCDEAIFRTRGIGYLPAALELLPADYDALIDVWRDHLNYVDFDPLAPVNPGPPLRYRDLPVFVVDDPLLQSAVAAHVEGQPAHLTRRRILLMPALA